MIWGSSFVFIRWGSEFFGPIPTACLRVGLATLVLLPVIYAKGLFSEMRLHWRNTFLMGCINSAIPFALLGYAVHEMSTGLASILNASTPLFGGLLAWLWLKDRPTSSRWLGLTIGFLGVAVLTLGRDPAAPVSEQASTWGILAILMATFFYGLAACFAQRHLRAVSALTTACGSLMGATALLALPTWWLWPAQMPPWHAWASIAALSIVCTAAAYALYFKLNTQIGATKAMSVTYLIPVFASLLGAVLFDESLSLVHLLSGAIILLGTALASGLWSGPKSQIKP
jgi:drug/metabolite transporter (DMT)-like permease